jgi:uncharacterized membrane protein
MNNIISNEIGFIHLISSVIALVAGTYVLYARKGDIRHRRWGYVYFVSMIVLLVTSFMLYELFGGFGVFHIASVVSSVTLFMGMRPVFVRKGNWVLQHLSWMYWSVMGLYAAFASEVITRLLPVAFWSGIGIVVAAIMLGGAWVFRNNIKHWESEFELHS